MTHVLIVESNTPDMVTESIAKKEPTQATFYGGVLQELKSDLQISFVAPYAGEAVNDPKQYDGVVFTGSGVAWCVDDARAAPLQQAMEQVFEAGVPSYGSCNGMQLAGFVLGGECGASPNGREDGIARDLRLTKAGKEHAMMIGRTPRFSVPCVHRDEVRRLPEGAVLLAENDHSPIQAFAYERGGISFWGSQYHPEYTAELVSTYLSNNGDTDMAEDMRVAASNDIAAGQLGTTVAELHLPIRTLELQNWLKYIAVQAAQAA